MKLLRLALYAIAVLGTANTITLGEDTKSIEARAKRCNTAADAVAFYQAALKDPTLDPEQRKLAEAILPQWQLRAKLGSIRIGTEFVDRAALSHRVEQIDRLLTEAEQLRDLDRGKLAAERLKAAAAINDNTIRAPFAYGIFLMVKGIEPVEAERAFRACLRNEPDNVAVLNNLAVLMMRLRKPQDALIHWRRLSTLKADPQSAHNLAGFIKIAESKEIPLTPTLFEDAKKSYAKMVIAGTADEHPDAGWLYSPLASISEEEYATKPMADFLYFQTIEDCSCPVCGGIGRIRCQNRCINGKIRVGTDLVVTGRNPVSGDEFTESRPVYDACPSCRGTALIECPKCEAVAKPLFWLDAEKQRVKSSDPDWNKR